METVNVGQTTGRRDAVMEEIERLCLLAHEGDDVGPEDVEAVEAIRHGEFCVVERTANPNSAYSKAATLRKKYTKADGWTIRATKVQLDGGEEGGLIAARFDGDEVPF